MESTWDLDTVRNAALLAVVVAVVLAVVVARIIQKLVLKAVLVVVLLGIGALLWFQRADLEGCARTCECRFLGQDVTLPDEAQAVCRQQG